MAHGDAREGKWRGNGRMEWIVTTLHTTSGHGVSSITNADAHISAASSRLNWRPRRYIWTRPFSQKDEILFMSVCHHISNAVYIHAQSGLRLCIPNGLFPMRFEAKTLYLSSSSSSSLQIPSCCEFLDLRSGAVRVYVFWDTELRYRVIAVRRFGAV